MKKRSKKATEIRDYDAFDTSVMIDADKRLTFEDIGLELPPAPPTQVISIRLPTELLNELKARGSRDDVPYQVLIKLILAEGLRRSANKPTAKRTGKSKRSA